MCKEVVATIRLSSQSETTQRKTKMKQQQRQQRASKKTQRNKCNEDLWRACHLYICIFQLNESFSDLCCCRVSCHFHLLFFWNIRTTCSCVSPLFLKFWFIRASSRWQRPHTAVEVSSVAGRCCCCCFCCCGWWFCVCFGLKSNKPILLAMDTDRNTLSLMLSIQ